MSRTRSRGWALAAALTLAAPLPAAAQLIQIQSIIAITPSEGGATPTHPWPDNRMSVGVTIGGSGPYPFVIDTAAERSVIASELAQELGLSVVGRSRLLSMNNTRPVDHVHAPDVSFAPGAAQDLRAFAVSGEHIGAAGVLGMDALQNQRLVIDFPAQRMLLEPATTPRRHAEGEIVVRARERMGRLVLAESVVGGLNVDVIIDTGLEVSLGNEALHRLLRTRREAPLSLRGATGETIEARYGWVEEFRLGSVRLANVPMAFADAHVFERMGLEHRPALLLGMETLRLFDRVTLDFPNRQAAFVLPQRPA